ncbi:ABC transporter ATP-binding protein [Dellaglioa sp. TMW 2.2444]|uniref:ABC transporter ATP-binding protein n=2 Tax=Dellaglioa carnosa TaxID=2995136 RepID=A0ABT4JN75_9LACO|nr:ABC transporter ATP-binding protein [Dellaglioa carnosa]MCZ2494970.1 ABC transporter ATP-binding protein [Dellaglioa carnosa]MDK1731833.1 ABC transporter ATP-binding protein [Dellaglioa carnosa]
MAFIEVDHVKKIYGMKFNRSTAIDNISFVIDPGEFVGIMGPSGAGKTTLLNIMSTIDKPTFGHIKIDNRDVTQYDEKKLSEFRRQKLGFVFQDFNLLNSLTIRENIILPLALDKLNVETIEEKLANIANVLNLNTILERFPNEVSIGQQQRAAVGRAIITEPKMLFADEPTGSLDSKAATELLQYLTDVNEKQKMTLMMVTHDAFTASYCKRIIFIKDGHVFAEIRRDGQRKDFFQKIIDMQAAIGGGEQ